MKEWQKLTHSIYLIGHMLMRTVSIALDFVKPYDLQEDNLRKYIVLLLICCLAAIQPVVAVASVPEKDQALEHVRRYQVEKV